MKTKIVFHNMPHSDALEAHAQEKLKKINVLFKNRAADQPLLVELFLNAETAHVPHHHVEFNLSIGQMHLSTHAKGADMYAVIDATIEKMSTLIKKEKDKLHDRRHRVVTEKVEFAQ